jgi:hypothetical protein
MSVIQLKAIPAALGSFFQLQMNATPIVLSQKAIF